MSVQETFRPSALWSCNSTSAAEPVRQEPRSRPSLTQSGAEQQAHRAVRRISPTISIVDAQFGLPAAEVAEVAFGGAGGYRTSSATTVMGQTSTAQTDALLTTMTTSLLEKRFDNCGSETDCYYSTPMANGIGVTDKRRTTHFYEAETDSSWKRNTAAHDAFASAVSIHQTVESEQRCVPSASDSSAFGSFNLHQPIPRRNHSLQTTANAAADYDPSAATFHRLQQQRRFVGSTESLASDFLVPPSTSAYSTNASNNCGDIHNANSNPLSNYQSTSNLSASGSQSSSMLDLSQLMGSGVGNGGGSVSHLSAKNVASLAAALVAAATRHQNATAASRCFDASLSVLGSSTNPPTFNGSIHDLLLNAGIGPDSGVSNHAEMLRTTLNVHELLGQSIANANANDMFTSATERNQVAESGSSNSGQSGASGALMTSNALTSTTTMTTRTNDEMSSAFLRPTPLYLTDGRQQNNIPYNLDESTTKFDTTDPIAAKPAAAATTTTTPPRPLVPTSNAKNSPNGGTSLDSFVTSAVNSLLSASPEDSNTVISHPSKSNNSGQTDVGAFSTCYTFEGRGVLLCQVCSDRASGFHYGINSCEGCKGFFRRSIQQKIQYKACAKSQQCQIVRANRNRCQDCRFQKCLAVGMSRDAVRFGRVPKREKAKMAEEMQRASVRSQMDALAAELEDDDALASSIERGFTALGDELRRIHREDAESGVESAYFRMIRAVVRFFRGILGFRLLYRSDCAHLLKSAMFQILLLRWSTLRLEETQQHHSTANGFSSHSDTFIDASLIPNYVLVQTESGADGGSCYSCCNRESNNNNSSNCCYGDNISTALQNSTVEFAYRFRLLNLTERQTAIFSALVLCQPDSTGGGIGTSTHLQAAPLLKTLQERLWRLLQSSLFPAVSAGPHYHISSTLLSQSLSAAFADLRALNAAHQEHLQRREMSTAAVALLESVTPPQRPEYRSESSNNNNSSSRRPKASGSSNSESSPGQRSSSSCGKRLSETENNPSTNECSMPKLPHVEPQSINNKPNERLSHTKCDTAAPMNDNNNNPSGDSHNHHHLSLATLAAVASSHQAMVAKRQHSSDGRGRHSIDSQALGELPTLRRALEQPPAKRVCLAGNINHPTTTTAATIESMHGKTTSKLDADALRQHNAILNYQLAATTTTTTTNNNNVGENNKNESKAPLKTILPNGSECYSLFSAEKKENEDEEPLNLCVRDMA